MLIRSFDFLEKLKRLKKNIVWLPIAVVENIRVGSDYC